jgi:hypothetical protein
MDIGERQVRRRRTSRRRIRAAVGMRTDGDEQAQAGDEGGEQRYQGIYHIHKY